jgi:hypothetical protein
VISHPETLRAAQPATADVPADLGPPRFESVLLECPTAFAAGASTTAADVQAAFFMGTNNSSTTANLLTNVYFPGAGATAATAFNAATLNPAGESFLVSTSFVGAISGSNQTEYQGWTCNSGYASFGSNSQSCTSLPSV